MKPGYLPRLIEVKASHRPWENFRPQDRKELLATALDFGAEAFLALAPGKDVSFVPSRDWPT